MSIISFFLPSLHLSLTAEKKPDFFKKIRLWVTGGRRQTVRNHQTPQPINKSLT